MFKIPPRIPPSLFFLTLNWPSSLSLSLEVLCHSPWPVWWLSLDWLQDVHASLALRSLELDPALQVCSHQC